MTTVGEGTESNRNSRTLLVGVQNDTATLEDGLAVSTKAKHSLPYDPAVELLGIYPTGLKTYAHTKTCM